MVSACEHLEVQEHFFGPLSSEKLLNLNNDFLAKRSTGCQKKCGFCSNIHAWRCFMAPKHWRCLWYSDISGIYVNRGHWTQSWLRNCQTDVGLFTDNGNHHQRKFERTEKAAIFTPLEQVNVTNELLKFQQNKISHSKWKPEQTWKFAETWKSDDKKCSLFQEIGIIEKKVALWSTPPSKCLLYCACH